MLTESLSCLAGGKGRDKADKKLAKQMWQADLLDPHAQVLQGARAVIGSALQMSLSQLPG